VPETGCLANKSALFIGSLHRMPVTTPFAFY